MRLRTALAVAVVLIAPAAARAQTNTYVFIGGSDVRIGRGVAIQTGNVASNGTAAFGASSVATSSFVVADTLLGAPGVIWQNIGFNHVEPRGAQLNGSQISPIPIPFVTLPAPPVVTPSPSN